jgi:hypothetical protein
MEEFYDGYWLTHLYENQVKREKKEAAEKAREDWVRENLKEGDIIRLNGTRDDGYRKVMGFEETKNYKQGGWVPTLNIFCQQVKRDRKTGEFRYWNATTNNGAGKIAEVLVDGDFIKIKELLK